MGGRHAGTEWEGRFKHLAADRLQSQEAADFRSLPDGFGTCTRDQITGAVCRKYTAEREGKRRSNKGKGGRAKRDLEELRTAVNHHAK